MATRWANFQASAGPFLQSALRTVQVAGFMVWFHDYLGVESMVVSDFHHVVPEPLNPNVISLTMSLD